HAGGGGGSGRVAPTGRRAGEFGAVRPPDGGGDRCDSALARHRFRPGEGALTPLAPPGAKRGEPFAGEQRRPIRSRRVGEADDYFPGTGGKPCPEEVEDLLGCPGEPVSGHGSGPTIGRETAELGLRLRDQ